MKKHTTDDAVRDVVKEWGKPRTWIIVGIIVLVLAFIVWISVQGRS